MPSGIENYDFQTVAGDTYFDGVKDLNGDGHYEVIVDVYFASGGSIDHCDATWPVIYAWTGDGYGDVSRGFKHYYEQQLAVLQKRNAAAEAEKERARQAAAGPKAPAWNCQAANVGESAAPAALGTKTGAGVSPAGVGGAHFCWPAPPPATLQEVREEERRGLDCDKAEAAKLERFLGVSRDAGMSDAIKWANSGNPHDRDFTADIFADIGTDQAKEYLKTLSHDPDRNVATEAKGWLSDANPSAIYTYPTIKGEFIPLTPGYPPAN